MSDTNRTPILLLALLSLACHAGLDERASLHFEPVAGGRERVLREFGSEFSVFVADGPLALSDDEIIDWVHRAALAVTTYYGRFPVEKLELMLRPVDGNDVAGGQANENRGEPVINVEVGSRADVRALADDWVLTHEMVHLATPSLPRDQLWFEEGVASYVEPIARVQSNTKPMNEVLREWVEHMPEGEPRRGDRGLDQAQTRERIYWGGALFCLSADVAIRERTSNRYGLQDALRAVMMKLGGGAYDSSIDDVIRIADAAVGVPVLRELYDQHANEARQTDLKALWTRLGIAGHRRGIHVDDSAPLAGALKAIFAPPSAR